MFEFGEAVVGDGGVGFVVGLFFAGEGLFLHDLEFEDFPTSAFEEGVGVDGEEVGLGGCHVVLVVILGWSDVYL